MRSQSTNRHPGMKMIALILLAGSAISSAARAAEDADLDVQSIVLYRSGVGYFERAGAVRGDQTVSLRFEADQINDILKSMILLDLDPDVGGGVETISYGSKEPLERRLDSFDIKISGAPDVASLFHQLRGEGVEITTNQGTTEGTILSVERRNTPAPEGHQNDDMYRHAFVNLVTSKGILSVAIDGILHFEFSDAEMGEQLQRALAALAEHRTERLKTVDLVFTGPDNRDRRVMLSYVHEMPVWKTTYRLVLPENKDDALTLQGWAIVENTTDHDWEHVQLSLASGRPVSFTMDLYEPIFARRAELPVPVTGALAGRTYEDGKRQDAQMKALRRSLGRANEPAPSEESRMRAMSELVMDQATAPGQAGGFADDERDYDAAASFASYANAAPSTSAAGGEVGEQFMYTLDAPITVERQRSAMIPIITSPIAGRRVSIYNAADMPKHPMRGAQLVNDSDLHLMPGPIAVYDSHAYAGDAQIPHTSRNQARLVAYALDLDVHAHTEHETMTTTINLKIVDGLVEEEVRNELTTTYTFDNHDSSRGRTVLVEHRKNPGWDLVSRSKPIETTDTLYRFETEIEPADSETFDVKEERISYQRFGLTSYPLETLVVHATNKRASPAVVNAVRQAATLQATINRLDRQINELDHKRDAISRDQDRIRSNMGRIDRNSQLYGRYMAKLNEQETKLESILSSREQASQSRARAQIDLNEFLKNLNVN